MDASPLINPQSTWVCIGPQGIVPSDQDEWRTLGECIGSHENLEQLDFRQINPTYEDLETLLRGVGQNRTVKTLRFYSCHGEWPLGMLAIFFQNNQNLRLLDASHCHGDIINLLSAALRGYTSRSLEHIIFKGTQTGGDATANFIEALAGHPHLEVLEFRGCQVGRRGCAAVEAMLQRPSCMLRRIWLDWTGIGDEDLALLGPAVAASSTLTQLSLSGMGFSPAALRSFSGVLRSPTCMLKMLDLCDNIIDDDVMISFADALATNRRLEILHLGEEEDEDNTISDIGFAAMKRALCNTSSINDAHSSNHTLKGLHLDNVPNDLWNYLRMNETEDKSLVARGKILKHFFRGNFSMAPFHETDMIPNALPHLLRWFGRTSDRESFAALFNFLRRMPSLWGNRRSVLRRSKRKRKVRD